MKFSGAPPSHDDDLLLVNAYLDGELDAAAALAIEHRIVDDQALKDEFDRLAALRKVLSENVHKDRASDALRSKIAGLAPSEIKRRSPNIHPRHFDWRHMAAAAVIAACLASGGTYLSFRQIAPMSEIAAIVAGHKRALLAATPFDVASSDRHTVKPWFDGKLAISPPVPNLAAAGFPLAGGRVDIVAGQAVPTLVYTHGPHLISLVAVPAVGSRDDGEIASQGSGSGFSVLTWRGQDFHYSAVSDVAQDTLIDFVSRWRAEAQAK